MVDWHNIYDRLPHPMRIMAANARGIYLRRWRYGPETVHLVEETLERDHWDDNRWSDWQKEQLAYILHRAATKVPYYKNYWMQQRRKGNRASWDVLENWPILKKEEVRKNNSAFVAEDCNVQKMFCDKTSGTTGTPLSIYNKKKTLREYYALFEARTRRWYGISSKERWAIMGGQRIVPFDQKQPPFWVFNAGLNQLYLSTYHLSLNNIKWYVDALHRYAPTHMIVYPSSAYTLSWMALENGLILPDMKVVVSNAEVLLDEQRKLISEAFNCSVRNTYGVGEMVTASSECEKGSIHIWPEVGIIEAFDDNRDISVKNGEIGRLILTGLLNENMPLIRYEVGDRGSLSSNNLKCSCGRTLPRLSKIEGRMNDMIVTPDGRQVFWLNPVFYNLPIREAQIIQEKIDRIRICYVPEYDFTPEVSRLIIDRLSERVGEMKVILEEVNEVPREANGKFQAVKSLLNVADNLN